ncbi:unnamed protein product [Symbiodinium natans]|uniref:Uncharacterized protein n=1 Tax=Symbiodinium natans TaxID=878477 RepID=A0A812J468_9DINO|nr:unnamed protein product [Symbiodinium natans]
MPRREEKDCRGRGCVSSRQPNYLSIRSKPKTDDGEGAVRQYTGDTCYAEVNYYADDCKLLEKHADLINSLRNYVRGHHAKATVYRGTMLPASEHLFYPKK